MTDSGVAFQITVDGTTVAIEGIRGYFQSRRAGLDAHLTNRLAGFLDDAHDTIDCAIYDLRHPRILASLANAVARGVQVRIVYDGGKERESGLSADPKPDGTEAALDQAGLLPHATAAHARGRHLMHDKFVLRDGRDVWVGSANFTEGGLELQDNVCLTFSSRPLVERFAAAFAALTQSAQQRRALADDADDAVESVMVGTTSVLPLFAPEAGESIEQRIVAAIQNSRKIRVMAFLLSDPGILQALAPLAHYPQFDIRGVYDPHGMEDVLRYTSQDDALFWFMRDPRFVAAPSHAFSAGREQDFMHNKTLVIDDHLVFTGSYNFSENAEANDEVVLEIASDPLGAAFAYYCDMLFTAYGGVIETPQTSKRLSGGPRPRVNSTPLPVVTNPRMKAVTAPPARGNTNPRLPAITGPLRRATPAPQPQTAPPTVAEVAATATPTRNAPPPAAEKPAKAPRKPSRALDILILVVRVKIAAIIIILIAYLLISEIIHL